MSPIGTVAHSSAEMTKPSACAANSLRTAETRTSSTLLVWDLVEDEVAHYIPDLVAGDQATIARELAAIAADHRSMDHPRSTDHDVARTRRSRHPPTTWRGPTAEDRHRARRPDAALSIIINTLAGLRGLRYRARCSSAGRRRCAAPSSSRLNRGPERRTLGLGGVLTIRRSKVDREGDAARRWQFRPVRIRRLARPRRCAAGSNGRRSARGPVCSSAGVTSS
jgi:hypothetical protein